VKKTVITFGLISGGVLSLTMAISLPVADRIGFGTAEVIGYTAIVMSFLFVFFGIRSYRENVGGGRITFGRALAVGALIALISSACYVVTWEILYFNFLPDFGDKYAAYAIEKAKASGASPEAVQAQLEQMKRFMELYRNPLINVAITFLEPLPIGLIIAIASAAILRRGQRRGTETQLSEQAVRR
jgi:hypothetical protein